MTICNHVWVEEDYGYLCTACGLVDPCFEGERRYDPDDWNENEDWNDDEEWFDCGWVRGVGCTLAGTESCDFDCPFRFEGYTIHSLRKYAITDWRTSGADLEVAAAMAGHAGVKVTAEIYSQATMERKRAAVTKKTS